MKKVLAITCFLCVSGCAGTQQSAFVGATPGCESSQAIIDNKTITTDFCIKKIMLKPSQYLVMVNRQPVFEGTDYTRVSFEKNTQDGLVTGGCDGLVEIQDTDTLAPVEISALPAELVSGCGIQADANGNSLAFRKDTACDQVFYKALLPLLGKVYPVEAARRCSVALDGLPVFEKEIRF